MRKRADTQLKKLLKKYPTVEAVGEFILQDAYKTVESAYKQKTETEAARKNWDNIQSILSYYLTNDTLGYKALLGYIGVHDLIIKTVVDDCLRARQEFMHSILNITSNLHPLSILVHVVHEDDTRRMATEFKDVFALNSAAVAGNLSNYCAELETALHAIYVNNAQIENISAVTGLDFIAISGGVDANYARMASMLPTSANELYEALKAQKDRGTLEVSEKTLSSLKTFGQWTVDKAISVRTEEVSNNCTNMLGHYLLYNSISELEMKENDKD